jgi:hypothetical protein
MPLKRAERFRRSKGGFGYHASGGRPVAHHAPRRADGGRPEMTPKGRGRVSSCWSALDHRAARRALARSVRTQSLWAGGRYASSDSFYTSQIRSVPTRTQPCQARLLCQGSASHTRRGIARRTPTSRPAAPSRGRTAPCELSVSVAAPKPPRIQAGEPSSHSSLMGRRPLLTKSSDLLAPCQFVLRWLVRPHRRSRLVRGRCRT